MTGARELLESVCTGFEPFEPPVVADSGADGPLNWPGYAEQRERAERTTGVDESVLCGRAWVGSGQAVLMCFEFGYLGGSIGTETGARIVRAFARARAERLPVISLVASGGSRLQEGIRALRQLQEIAQACVVARRSGIPHITVLRHPTTGGVWASLASSADLVLAMPGAEVAFGGSRVRVAETVGDSFTSEGKLATGQVDRIVEPEQLPEQLARLLDLVRKRGPGPPEPVTFPSAADPDLPESGWAAVRRARAPERVSAAAHLAHYFPHRFELGGTDTGMRCGIGELDGRAVAFAAQCGRPNTPAGFRVAARLVRFADRLGLPVLTLVDTPGATNDSVAEHNGIGPAIAELFAAVAEVEVPVSTLVVGEGGSGGALALTSPDRVWISSDGYFAVLAPESLAAVLKQPPDRVAELADQSWLRPQDLLDLGVVLGIVEPLVQPVSATDQIG